MGNIFVQILQKLLGVQRTGYSLSASSLIDISVKSFEC